MFINRLKASFAAWPETFSDVRRNHGIKFCLQWGWPHLPIAMRHKVTPKWELFTEMSSLKYHLGEEEQFHLNPTSNLLNRTLKRLFLYSSWTFSRTRKTMEALMSENVFKWTKKKNRHFYQLDLICQLFGLCTANWLHTRTQESAAVLRCVFCGSKEEKKQ